MPKSSSVLVVEDNAQNMMMMRDLLQAQGYEVLEARDGKQGWDLARTHRPDLMLMDIQLPDVSGLEVTRWLKADDVLRAIPVVAVTAFAMKGDAELMREMGCDGYIAKPISVLDFLRVVARIIDPTSGGDAEPSSSACLKRAQSS